MEPKCTECGEVIIRGKSKFRQLAAKTCGKRCARVRKTALQKQSRQQTQLKF